MEAQLWDLFCETGDPMGYLLLCAERREEAGEAERPPQKPQEASPAAL